mgnify:CR=1
MPYFAELYNQRTKTWKKYEYKTLTGCRKACYHNIKTTDAYTIPITKSKTGKVVVGEVGTRFGEKGIFYSSYGNPDYGLYVLNKDGTKGKLVSRTENFNRRLYLE